MANDKLMSSLNAEFMAELGRELERLEDLVSVLVKRNDRLREVLQYVDAVLKRQGFVDSTVVRLTIKEALK